jgi:hypothetical protein
MQNKPDSRRKYQVFSQMPNIITTTPTTINDDEDSRRWTVWEEKGDQRDGVQERLMEW